MTGEVLRHIIVTFRAVHDDETGQYVARCEELEVSTFGPTIEEAFAELNDAVVLYLNTLEEVGERERTFQERGIVLLTDPNNVSEISIHARPEEIVSPRELVVPVPA